MKTVIEKEPVVTEITKESRKLATEAEVMLKVSGSLKIGNNDGYVHAGERLKKIKLLTDEIEMMRKSMTRPLDESKKRIMDFFRKPLDYLVQAESSIKRAMLSWQQEQERKRREEEERLQELARRDEEKKRKALEERALKAEAKGDIEKAEELREKAEEVFVPTPIVPSQVEKINGISTKKIWKFRIVDVVQIPREYMVPNEKMLGEIARATKGTLVVPGVEFYFEETVASGKI